MLVVEALARRQSSELGTEPPIKVNASVIQGTTQEELEGSSFRIASSQDQRSTQTTTVDTIGSGWTFEHGFPSVTASGNM